MEERDISNAVNEIRELVVAGWTGRDVEAMEAHISELERLGVSRPKTTPIFYRVAADLLTTATRIQVPGKDSSGEVEAILINYDGTVWIGVGSDHTDRKIETVSITVSKQMCAKPLGSRVWHFDEIQDHWDDLILRSYATIDSDKILYQEGSAATMRHPNELLELKFGSEAKLPPHHAMFCGTVPVLNEISFADTFEIEIFDPVLNRSLNHIYDIQTLPVEG